MQTDNRLLDDLAKVASGALGSLSGVKHEVETRLQRHLEGVLSRMNLVSREEFDAMSAVAQAAREEQIKLEARVRELEARLDTHSKPSRKAAADRESGQAGRSG